MMLVDGHNFRIWRTAPDDGYTLWAKCMCGVELYANTYDEMAGLTADHFEAALAEAEAEAEEREHEIHG